MVSTSRQPQVYFTETQRFTQWWFLLLVAGIFGIAAGAVLTTLISDDSGQGAAITGAVALTVVSVLVGGLLSSALIVEVRSDAIEIRHLWFIHRVIRYDEIATAEARTYRPWRDYGGWGWRLGPAGTAYNVRGNRGLQLHLTNGKRILIGSQHASEFEAAVKKAMAG